jgi:2'-5' RNA ligase
MSDSARPIFSTFEEAWARFAAGGTLVPVEEQREGFVRGRAQFLSLQVPIGDMEVVQEIADVQDALADIEGLSLTPPELLHISVRGIGFQVIALSQPGDVLRQDVRNIGQRAAKALKGAKPIAISLGPVNVFPDALILEVRPIEPMRELLRRVNAINEQDAFPYSAESYLPHITIATFLTTDVATALRQRLPLLRERPVLAAEVRRIDYVRWWFTGHDLAAWPELDTVRSFRLR